MPRRPSNPSPGADKAAASGSEIELKLSLPGADPARVGAVLAQLPFLSDLPVTVQRLDNVYFDTPDQRLHRARAALRVRRIEVDGAPARWVQTLKTAPTATGGLSQRGEWETPAAGPALDLAALQAAPAWPPLDPDGTLWPELAPAFVTEATRTLREVQGEHGARIELVLDIGRVRTMAAGDSGAAATVPGGKKASAGQRRKTKAPAAAPAASTGQGEVALCELELELLAGQPDALFALADQIAQHIAVLPASVSKAERGWRLLEGTTHAPRRARLPSLTRATPVSAAAAAVLAEALGQFLDNLGGILQSDGPELVHQARVGWRRWRSALWMFKPLFAHHPLPDAAPLRPLLKAMGATRDLDVAGLESLPPWSEAYIDGDAERAEQWQAMETAVQAERRIRRAGLLSVLQAPATGRALLQLEQWLHALPQATAATDVGAQPLGHWARRRARRLHRRLKQAVRALKNAPAPTPPTPGSSTTMPPVASPDHQHRVRLLAKRTRYVLQSLTLVLPKRRTRRWADRATDLQTRIGAARDLMLLATLLEPLGVHDSILGFMRGVAAGRLADD